MRDTSIEYAELQDYLCRTINNLGVKPTDRPTAMLVLHTVVISNTPLSLESIQLHMNTGLVSRERVELIVDWMTHLGILTQTAAGYSAPARVYVTKRPEVALVA